MNTTSLTKLNVLLLEENLRQIFARTLAYINDMPYSVSSSLALFADDSFLHKSILEFIDGQVLQKDLDKLSVWETNWLMEFYSKKCKILRITKQSRKTPHMRDKN